MKTSNISRCPFCKNLINKIWISEDRSFSQVRCKCGARGPIYDEKLKDMRLTNEELAEKAINLWNVGGEQYPPVVDYQIWRIVE